MYCLETRQTLVEIYRPIPLLPIFGKIFEEIIFNRIYSFLLQEDLLNPNQSGFRPSDSATNQLLALSHMKYLKHLIAVHLWKLGQFF